jgi:serine/threonine-protein kinase
MSPEQFTAREPIDFRSDIWACGVVLYELLTGTRPFSGNTGAMIGQAVVNDPFDPPSRRIAGLPAAFDQLISRALRKAPAERFASAQAFATAIAIAAQSLAANSAKPPKPERNWAQLAGGIAVIILLAAGIGTWWLESAPTKNSGEPAPKSAPTASRPLPERLAALTCSTVRAAPTGMPDVTGFTGIIGSGAPRSEFDAIIASLPESSVHNTVQTFPSSEVACRLAELVRANRGDSATFLTTSGGQTTLVTDNDIRLRLSMPNFDGLVRLDDLNSDGQIDHLMEANFGQSPRFRANTLVGLGKDGDDLIGHVSPPYGTDILVALVTSEPLFVAPRPGEEAAGAFVDSLEPALAALRRRGGQVAADALVLTTAPR